MQLLHSKYSADTDTPRLLNYVSLILGTDPEETILNAFKIFDPEGKGHIKAD